MYSCTLVLTRPCLHCYLSYPFSCSYDNPILSLNIAGYQHAYLMNVTSRVKVNTVGSLSAADCRTSDFHHTDFRASEHLSDNGCGFKALNNMSSTFA